MAAPSKTPEPKRLYQQIADQVRSLIVEGRFAPGARLPAERDLAQQLGVSRPSLREALIALEIEGRVEIRMGSGLYVGVPAEPAAPPGRSLGESPSELMQARIAIEGAVAMLACARTTPDFLGRLRAILAAMEAEIAAGRSSLEQDRLFHIAIADQAGNSVLTRMVTTLFGARHGLILSQISRKFDSQETWAAALAEHHAILAALEAADPLLAQAAMLAHLKASMERWIGT